MSTRQGSSPNTALRTSLPTAFASVVEESSYAQPTQEEQDRYLAARPGATARHLGIALQHAQQIQAQKDAEGMILDRTIELLEIPTSPSAEPATPSPNDVQSFKTALQLFRPGDYDNLIMERNYEDLCGYGLCPRQNRKQLGGTGSTFHFKYGAKGSGPGGRGRAVDIVPKGEFGKVLSEQPVWERRADETEDIRIELLEESRERRQRQKQKQKAESSKSASADPQNSESDITAGLRDLKIREAERSQELALERGDAGSSLRKGRVDIQVKEKEPSSHATPTAPQLGPGDEMGGSIEGYIPHEQLEESSNTLKDRDILDQL
ncbi:hypothetical protein N7533_012056 [Penicillium manginii]|uniref:uncharacterized protein n=1 Tax=Penicillium manginii TaxID=203109 RepID=UPI002549495F|nr:uncharacterized protein N7533_012056 [Penicillium manginii]KAJ5739272.1 hypothetical protein N7533_012056 [Penicillium manginii]